jgi:hypothetical protein
MHLVTSVADPVLFFTPGSGMENNQDPGCVPDYFSDSLETDFRVKNTKHNMVERWSELEWPSRSTPNIFPR